MNISLKGAGGHMTDCWYGEKECLQGNSLFNPLGSVPDPREAFYNNAGRPFPSSFQIPANVVQRLESESGIQRSQGERLFTHYQLNRFFISAIWQVMAEQQRVEESLKYINSCCQISLTDPQMRSITSYFRYYAESLTTKVNTLMDAECARRAAVDLSVRKEKRFFVARYIFNAHFCLLSKDSIGVPCVHSAQRVLELLGHLFEPPCSLPDPRKVLPNQTMTPFPSRSQLQAYVRFDSRSQGERIFASYQDNNKFIEAIWHAMAHQQGLKESVQFVRKKFEFVLTIDQMKSVMSYFRTYSRSLGDSVITPIDAECVNMTAASLENQKRRNPMTAHNFFNLHRVRVSSSPINAPCIHSEDCVKSLIFHLVESKPKSLSSTKGGVVQLKISPVCSAERSIAADAFSLPETMEDLYSIEGTKKYYSVNELADVLELPPRMHPFPLLKLEETQVATEKKRKKIRHGQKPK